MARTLIASCMAAMLLVGTTAAAQPAKSMSVVLVHGAFVDGSGWRGVHDLLVAKGYEVLVVQNSTVTLKGDVEITRRAIAEAKGPVVLVGHSYGGAVITEAGDDPKVASLVYVAAFAPDVGESVETLIANPPPRAPPVPIVAKDGFLMLDKEKFPAVFAGDAPLSTGRFMAASQTPWGQGALSGKVGAAAWKAKPTFYVVTANDLIVPPEAQRQMAQRAGATRVEVNSSHAAMVSHPADIVTVIERAAAATPAR